MRYQSTANNRLTIAGALNAWRQRAARGQLAGGARMVRHPDGSVHYHCGGIGVGGGNGADYVDPALYLWVINNLPTGWELTEDPAEHDYHTLSCRLDRPVRIQGHEPDIPDGYHRMVIHFQLYVGARDSGDAATGPRDAWPRFTVPGSAGGPS